MSSPYLHAMLCMMYECALVNSRWSGRGKQSHVNGLSALFFLLLPPLDFLCCHFFFSILKKQQHRQLTSHTRHLRLLPGDRQLLCTVPRPFSCFLLHGNLRRPSTMSEVSSTRLYLGNLPRNGMLLVLLHPISVTVIVSLSCTG